MIKINNILFKLELEKVHSDFINKKFTEVINKTEKILRSNLKQPRIYNYIGLSYLQLNQLEKAETIFMQALKEFPTDLSIICNLALVYKKQFKLDEAKKFFKKALQINPRHLQSTINFAHLENGLNHTKIANDYYLNAYKINNNSQEVLNALILSYLAIGEFSKAKIIIEELNKKFPKNTMGDHFFSRVHHYEENDLHQKKMLDRIKTENFNAENLSNLYFAIAKSYFDQKNIKQAAHYTLAANEKKFETYSNYSFEKEEKEFKKIKDLFLNYNFKDTESQNGKNLIFILGLPRSGTTLLHRILSSHSKIFGAEESKILSEVFGEIFKSDDKLDMLFKKQPNNSDLIHTLSNNIQSRYKFYDNEKIIVDKMPFNFKWIGMIKILFPKAKIIHSKRNLIDTSFSIYRNLFESPKMGWTCNHEYLIKYVKLYSELMDFWRSKLDNFIYDCDYENLVKNQFNETNNILKFCNLDFEENCLNFDKLKSSVKTISVAQARKKIYADSINLSKDYLEYFPFLKKLSP